MSFRHASLAALKPALFQVENDDDRDECDHDCEHEQNGLHVIAHPSEMHGVRHQNTRAGRIADAAALMGHGVPEAAVVPPGSPGRVLINAQIAAPLFTGLAASACPTNAIDEETL